MIIDVHTHLGEYPRHLSEGLLAEARATWGADVALGTTPEAHYEAMRGVDRAIVLAFQAPAAGFDVPNDYVADYVRRDPGRLIGFGSVDPHDPAAPEELERMRDELGLRGCKMGPIYQDVDPLSPPFLRVCEVLERLKLPMLIHQGTTFVRAGPLLHARPVLLDEIARRFPDLRIVIAHVGHPWVEEAIVVVRKHPNVYADVSALHPRPWQLYHTLRTAIEYRVDGKLLFGSDYPFFTPEETIAGLRSAAELARRARLPEIPEEVIEGIVHRPALELLGLGAQTTKLVTASDRERRSDG
jgi:hypothetical protein